MAKPARSQLLHPSDLIEDREVTTQDRDQLAHAQIAEQLAELVTTVPTPSNVALYGPWGSGKSGIGNLLRNKVGQNRNIKFARFDAFKYAEAPLRRNFISAVASELKVNDSKFRSDLYTGKSQTSVSLGPRTLGRIFLTFSTLLLLIAVVMAVVLSLIAWRQGGAFGPAFAKLAAQTAASALLPAALLSALMTMASKTLQVDRSVGKPDSDEQFEEIFVQLVKKSGANRLVIFVDELDRCSADDVVATLDAIRTFLGVEKCVFVIAADQQVLEESLTRAAKQETPANEVNPYYSTGSAYLDKVFQYQVSLPPLLSHRITRFAADLVKDRGGVWSEIATDYVVSVLVPTHVTSPRRVKHLLNTFALSYRIAEQRFRESLLSDDPRSIAPSLAKLVCLRVEFPLFARDLELDARLPELVLAIANKVQTDDSWSPQAISRAEAYANDGEAPASLIIEGTDDGRSEAFERTTKQSNRQLLDYLKRTQLVSGPSRDLVHLHSTGAAFGLDGQTALTIERAAEDANYELAREQLRSITPENRGGAIELLTQLLRTSIGLGAPNAAQTLLRLYANDDSLSMDKVANSASDTIAVLLHEHPAILNNDTVESAWKLASAGTADGASRLREAILRYAESIADADVTFILRHPAPAFKDNGDALARLVTSAIVRDGGDRAVHVLRELPDSHLLQLVTASSTLLEDALRAAVLKYSEHEKAQEASDVPATTVTAATEHADDDVPFDAAPIIHALTQLASERTGTEVAQQIALTLLKTRTAAGRIGVAKLVECISPVHQGTLLDALLEAVSFQPISLWPKWISAIAPNAIEPQHVAAVKHLAEMLWTRAAQDNISAETADNAARSLKKILVQLPATDRPDITAQVTDTLSGLVTTDAIAQYRETTVPKIQALIDIGLVSREQLSRAALPSLVGTYATSFNPVLTGSGPLSQYLVTTTTTVFNDLVPCDDETLEIAREITSTLSASTTIEEPFKTVLILTLSTATKARAEDFSSTPDLAAITALVEQFGAAASKTVSMWLELTRPSAAETAELVGTLLGREATTADIAQALSHVRADWSATERLDLLSRYIAKPESPRLHTAELELVGLKDVPPDSIATILIARFEGCQNNPQRRSVIDMWDAASISEDSVRRRLIQSIVIPLLGQDGSPRATGQTDIALDALQRLGSPLPYGIKRALGEAVQKAVEDNEALEKKASNVMPRLGYSSQRRGFFQRKTTIDYTG
ncbi:hypothetical protein ABIA30_005207 [Mycobacterium sp. MAA66]|uniref:KAP family P-loop NTPase fold protein n=1 Tax=Mycobacterium sp. MAA66 TaxID=3156297 RepID=UPI0035133D85